ncbi:hypothetical protein [Nitrosospira multiformis]|nr:hypothetical protein [Nitrosospira multiformis]
MSKKKAEENMMQAALQREMAREQAQRNLNSPLLDAARRREDEQDSGGEE